MKQAGEKADVNTDRLVETVQETIRRHGLISRGQTVLVAVSGGPDSTALLHILTTLRETWNLHIVAAHLNHGFRGAEAEEEAAYVSALCRRLDVTCFLSQEDVPARRKRLHLSAQEGARQARHAFLRHVAQEAGAERIALGHTRDDRVETILLNLFRGTGPDGLIGFPPLQLPLIRPLYDVSREETHAYCAAFDLQPRADSSNSKMDYRRNRLRSELLPILTAYYNERVGEAILRLSNLVSADNVLLEKLAEQAGARLVLEQNSAGLVLDRELLNREPIALRRRILRQAIQQVRGHLRDIGFETVEQILDGDKVKFSRELPADGETVVIIHGNAERLTIEQSAAIKSDLPWQVEIGIPGRTDLPVAGVFIETRLCETLREAREKAHAYREETEGFVPGGRRLDPIIIRIADVTLPLAARSRRVGDRMRPVGLNGSKKVQDLFTDARIPTAERGRIPILADSGGNGRIIAVFGVHRDEKSLQLTGPDSQEDGPILWIVVKPL